MAWIFATCRQRSSRLWAIVLLVVLGLGGPRLVHDGGFSWGASAALAQASENAQPEQAAAESGAANSVQDEASGASAATSSADTPRPGTPSFWRAGELFLKGLALYVQIKLLGAAGLAVGWIVALVLSFGLGAISFWIAFSMGTFAPKAAALGVWMMSLLLGLFSIMLLPLSLPWWTPIAMLCAMFLLPALLVGSMSKKSVA